jgi:uncharacterized protein YidB (DUF937 family)
MSRVLKIGVAIIAVAALAAGAVGFVNAQSGEGDAAGHQSDFIEKLAGHLGIDTETLLQAIRDTQIDQLDEAVADGRVPEDRAADIRERIESGDAPLFPFGRGPGHHMIFGIAAVRQTAEFLNIDAEAVVQALQDGGTLAGVAEANGKTPDELAAYLLSELRDAVQQGVDNNRITQERADEILANAPDKIDALINQAGPFRGPRGWQGGDLPELPASPEGAGLFF